jgi:aminoglycoside phosphotransferase
VILRKHEGTWAGRIANINAEAACHFAVTSKSLDRIVTWQRDNVLCHGNANQPNLMV